MGGYRAQHMTIRKTLLGCAIFFASFLYNRKKTWMTNEMDICTRGASCGWKGGVVQDTFADAVRDGVGRFICGLSLFCMALGVIALLASKAFP